MHPVLKNLCQNVPIAAVACFFHFFTCHNVVATEIKLVEKGVPQVDIVVSSNTSQPVSFAASEFAKYVKKISGAHLHIREEEQGIGQPSKASSKQIILGMPSTNARVSKLLLALRLNSDGLGEDGFLISPIEGDLLVCGNSGRAVLYAVYGLLERFGCRWCFPGKYGEVIPKQSSLKLVFKPAQLKQIEQPAFSYRNFYAPRRSHRANCRLDRLDG